MTRLSIVLAATLVLGGDLFAQAVPEDAQAAKVPMAYRRTPQLRVDPFRHVMIPHWGLVISGGGLVGNEPLTPRLGQSLGLDGHDTSHLYQLGTQGNPFHGGGGS